jgi:cyclic pyranopterin phosphate synthase
MPEDQYLWLPKEDVLSFEEILQLSDLLGAVGVDRIRITGGEPLLRRDLPDLIRKLADRAWVRDLALTTNGLLLEDMAPALKAAGLHRLTISLDTLRQDRFERLARVDALDRVLTGIDAARRAGFSGLKLDSVLTRGDNDDELIDLLKFARDVQAEIRFIEYMDVGGATRWLPEAVISRTEMLNRIAGALGPVTPVDERSSAPADRFQLEGGQTFGIISSTTLPFCRTCDRLRLTADGVLLLCLYAQHGTDLRRPLRAGASPETLARLIQAVWTSRADRGAEERRGVRDRGAFIPLSMLKSDAHLEMHTRGG